MTKSDLSRPIKLCSNRLRCDDCNATGVDSLFISKPEVRLRSTCYRAPGPPMIKINNRWRLNAMKAVDVGLVLIRICMKCGTTREMRIPNNRALGYG